MSKVTAIVLAGGSGKRMNSAVKKQYIEINEVPLIVHTLLKFENSDVDEIVCVAPEEDLDYFNKEVVDAYSIKKVSKVVAGGRERYESVYNALKVINDCEIVLIHDGARPFVTNEVINENIKTAREKDACITAVPVKDTIKRIDQNGVVEESLKRDELWQVQTPQSFKYDLIRRAYDWLETKSKKGITDDAMVAELYGVTVYVVKGSYYNIKVTTPDDIPLAEFFSKLYK